MAGVTYSELARREAELARAELARAQGARRFALRQADEGLSEYFLRVASRCERDSGNHADRARRFEALAGWKNPHDAGGGAAPAVREHTPRAR